jgi:hypothetical protein
MIYTEAILKDTKLDQDLLAEGYVVVPFLNENELEGLKQFFYENHPNDIPGFYASAHSKDLDFRNKMNAKIKQSYASSIDRYFSNCEALGGSFVVKTKEQKEKLHPHQDWNIVDESNYRSFNIWVPLVDLTEENGAIRVLPGSHLWGENYRGPNIPEDRPSQLDEIWEKMLTLNMKAGEALIYDHRLYHASYPNQQDEFRLACVFGIKPKEAEMFYYFGKEEGIEVYKSSVAFFMEGDIQKGPEVLELVAIIQGSPSLVEEKAAKTTQYSFLDKLKRLFQ